MVDDESVITDSHLKPRKQNCGGPCVGAADLLSLSPLRQVGRAVVFSNQGS